MFQSFIDQLKDRLKEGLPGESAQYKLAPLQRKSKAEYLRKDLSPRKSAVLILLYEEDGRLKFPLMLRPSYDGFHSGQISFPGGKVEEGEAFTDTALREAEEEIGILSKNIEVLGTLTDLYIPASKFIVYPVLAYSSTLPYFLPNKYEVEKIITVDVECLLATEIKTKPIQVSTGAFIDCPFYDYEDHTIWGATAMIISELLELLDHSKAS